MKERGYFMAFTFIKKTETIRVLTTKLTNVIHACKDSCGLILIACKLDTKQLKALKKHLTKETSSHPPRFFYDGASGVLGIIFEGAKLSYTHWVGLAVKTYLLDAFAMDKSVLVASFLAKDFPATRDVEESLHQLMTESSTSANLIVYKNFDKFDKRERVVLIIDDDESAAEFLKIKLESQGYEVHQAYDGVQGIRSCEDISPDVVIMELNLPALDGYQVIRNIQGNDELETQIIVLSEQKLEKDVDACLDLGVSNYITKPYSPLELETTLHKVLEETVDQDAVI
jgi:two-component system OmpR family response regulator